MSGFSLYPTIYLNRKIRRKNSKIIYTQIFNFKFNVPFFFHVFICRLNFFLHNSVICLNLIFNLTFFSYSYFILFFTKISEIMLTFLCCSNKATKYYRLDSTTHIGSTPTCRAWFHASVSGLFIIQSIKSREVPQRL